jgi:2-amino-4-hydroxy-6-hydroxymethyldihydropteridine diphosphokinase
MSTQEVVLSLGSNMGNSVALLRRALTLLDARSGVTVAQVSHVYLTAPQGYANQPDFANIVAIVMTSLSPRELLRATSAIEKKLGRVRSVPNGPRTIDIDIIAYGRVSLNGAQLTIPHPRASQRRFVLVPWLELQTRAALSGRPLQSWCRGLKGQACSRTSIVVI